MDSLFDPSSIFMLLMMVLGGGVRDLASTLSTEAYWKSKGVTVSIDQLSHDLEAVKPADVSKLIADLDADDAKDRDTAAGKIVAVGPAAIPGLEEAAKTGSPEVVVRAGTLLSQIRATSKAMSVRRLMAIRTLGEMKDPKAAAILKPLLDSKEMFEADYAKTAMARIEGKNYTTPAAAQADRLADMKLLPARLDVIAQIALPTNGILSIEKAMAQSSLDEPQKNKSREEVTAHVIKILDTVGNIRLDALTWGFYAAPTGQPGNSILIGRGEFDSAALSVALGKLAANTRRINGVEIFQINDDAALLVTSDRRVVFLVREPNGELGLETMVAALKKGEGDLATNADLSKLVQSVDMKATLWSAAIMSSGLKDVAGPLADFDSVTLIGQQAVDDKNVLTTDFHLEAVTTDAAKARQVVANMRQKIDQSVEQGRKQQAGMPFITPMVDFAASIKLETDGGKATATGMMHEIPIFPMAFGMRAAVPN